MKIITKQTLLFFLGILISIIGYSQETRKFDANQIEAALQGNSTYEVQSIDPNPNGVEETVTSTIKLAIDIDKAPYKWFRYTSKIEVIPMSHSGNFDIANAYQITLNVENTIERGTTPTLGNQQAHLIKSSQGVRIRILEGRYQDISAGTSEQINGYIPENLFLEIGTTAPNHRYLRTNQAPVVTGVKNTTNELELSWNAIQGALQYDVEWTWIDNYGTALDNVLQTHQIQLTARDFQLNNTRIQTEQTNYKIPLIYAQGYIIYRVRTVGKFENGEYRYGKWSKGINNEQTVADWKDGDNNVYRVTATDEHEAKKNWQFQASYAEEGKKKEVISYFDGTLRNRQTVTKINSDDNTIVGEVIYDAQGRPAIEVLPVPTTEKELKYFFKFNISENGSSYNYEDFDKDSQNQLDEFFQGKEMKTSYGASHYYSKENTVNEEFRDRGPDAEKFPFSQIEYTPDNTGRIRRKGGVGKTHQLGNGHEMEYYYGTPEQKELNRLFGYSVGNKIHYKKNLVKDPNGQISVSYVDPQGRTIATALTGISPKALEGLEDENNEELHKNITVDLLGKVNQGEVDKATDNNIKSSSGVYGPLEDKLVYYGEKVLAFEDNRTLNYSIANTSFEADCGNIKYPVVYDVIINAYDADANGLIVEEGTNNIHPIIEQVTIDDSNPKRVFEEVALNNIPRGSHSITKKVIVNAEAIERYADEFIAELKTEGSLCYIPIEEITLPAEIEDGCFVSCEECEASLGEKEDYVIRRIDEFDFSNLSHLNTSELAIETNRLREIFARQWEELVIACNVPCNDVTIPDPNTDPEVLIANAISCNVAQSTLINDMKPNGQYGAFRTQLFDNEAQNQNGSDLASNGPILNIYSEENKLRSTKIDGDEEIYQSWRNPRHYLNDTPHTDRTIVYTTGHYYNEDGSISYIEVQEKIEINAEGKKL